MKFATISSVVMATTSSVTAYEGHFARELVVGGDVVPIGSKTYMAGLRVDRDSETVCGGSLITPTHVLSASHCTDLAPRWVSIGEHYTNGTDIGEQIKIVSMMNHPNFSVNSEMSHDFMLIELERPSKFQPVKLAAADDSDFQAGKTATGMGWGLTETNGNMSYELQRIDLALASDAACKAFNTEYVDSSMFCAGGVANHSTCFGDSGGPLIVESPEGDVLVGVTSWLKNFCGTEGEYGVYARVSSVIAWIETITSGTCLA